MISSARSSGTVEQPPINPAGHLFYMADPSNPADNFSQDLCLPPPPPGTSANGAPGADADDEGPKAASWVNWLSCAGLILAGSVVVGAAISASGDLQPSQQPSYPPHRPYGPGNPYDSVTSGRHSSCPLCSTPYQSGRGSSYSSGPRDAMIGHEQTRTREPDGPHRCRACGRYYPTSDPENPYDSTTSGRHSSCPLCSTPYQSGRGSSYSSGPRAREAMIGHKQTRDGPDRCPACGRYCPTTPTGPSTRFLRSERTTREDITGYSSSQQYLNGVTTTIPKTDNTFLSYRSPAGVYGSVATAGTSGLGYQAYQVSPADSRQSIVGYPSSQQYLGGVTNANANTNNTFLSHRSPAGVYRDVATTGTSGSGYQVSPADGRTSERTSRVTRTQPQNYTRMYDGSSSQVAYSG
jgi:hypothetical protein